MTLKKINPEDLKVGQECYIKVVTEKVKTSDGRPVLRDMAGNLFYPSNGEPIYTHEPSLEPTAELTEDRELEMLVSVASRIYTDPTFEDGIKDATIIALDLITACKNELRKQP